MITRATIDKRVREWSLREDIVEKDYVLGWVLWGIGTDPTLGTTWVFKGGTCLKKCYFETYRFSKDLDFTVIPGGPLQPEELLPILEQTLRRVSEESGIDFTVRPSSFRIRPSGQSTESRIYYRGPRNAPSPASIKLDLSGDERVVRPPVFRKIAHIYDDELPSPAEVQCYSFEELFAEKIRAMGERARPRDLYDIVNLFRRYELRSQHEVIRSVLVEKCQAKGIPTSTFTVIKSSPYLAQLESEWANMLAHQLPALPPFAQFWEELPQLFAWLEGTAIPKVLAPMPIGVDVEPEWLPPSTIQTWDTGVPLEAVRFAAVNHLCVELGYQGTTRLIEPYSLRRTRDGHLLLYAIKADTRKPRAYRVDRIESVKVSTRPFTPIYTIEFAPTGPLSAPPTTMRTVGPRTRSVGGRTGRRGVILYLEGEGGMTVAASGTPCPECRSAVTGPAFLPDSIWV